MLLFRPFLGANDPRGSHRARWDAIQLINQAIPLLYIYLFELPRFLIAWISNLINRILSHHVQLSCILEILDMFILAIL